MTRLLSKEIAALHADGQYKIDAFGLRGLRKSSRYVKLDIQKGVSALFLKEIETNKLSFRTRFMPVNVIVNRPSNTKLRPQVKQARVANKNGRCNGAVHLL